MPEGRLARTRRAYAEAPLCGLGVGETRGGPYAWRRQSETAAEQIEARQVFTPATEYARWPLLYLPSGKVLVRAASWPSICTWKPEGDRK